MGKLFNAALAVGFAVMLERGVRKFLDKRDEKKAVAKAARTGFGTSTPEAVR
jgi:hypothetical protein